MVSKRKIVIFSATIGGGHQRVAEVVSEQLSKQAKTQIIDFFELVDPNLNELIKMAYVQSVNFAPRVYGKFYKIMDRFEQDSPFQRFLNSLGRKKLKKYFDETSPDIAVCTYPTPIGVISSMLLRGQTNLKNVAIITDYVIHSQWIHPRVDLYLVPSDLVKQGIISFGVEESKIKVTGMPVDSHFEMNFEKGELIDKWRLEKGYPIVLIMAGAYGMGRVDEIVRAMSLVREPFRALIICGKDEGLKRKSEEIIGGDPRFKTLGFVREVYELMDIADVIVTKAGGITISEAMNKALPIIIYKPIPGQETHNTNYLRTNGAAAVTTSAVELIELVEGLLRDEGARSRLGESARRLVKRNSAAMAAKEIVDLIDK